MKGTHGYTHTNSALNFQVLEEMKTGRKDIIFFQAQEGKEENKEREKELIQRREEKLPFLSLLFSFSSSA